MKAGEEGPAWRWLWMSLTMLIMFLKSMVSNILLTKNFLKKSNPLKWIFICMDLSLTVGSILGKDVQAAVQRDPVVINALNLKDEKGEQGLSFLNYKDHLSLIYICF
jgi:hypothetical protein